MISKERACLPHLYITRAPYLHINSNQNLNRKHFWTMEPCRPGRSIDCDINQAKAYLAQVHITNAVYQLRSSMRNVSGTAVYHKQRGITVYTHYINSNSKLKRKHGWATPQCRPGQYINRDQQYNSIYGATVYHQLGISTAFSKVKAYLIPGAAVYPQRGI